MLSLRFLRFIQLFLFVFRPFKLEELESSTLFSDGAPTKRKQYKQYCFLFAFPHSGTA